MIERIGLLRYLILVFFISCSPAYKKYVSDYKTDNNNQVPDYSKLEYWAAHPYKHNPSDSVPAPLRATTIKDSVVDVFFLHPTTFGLKSDTAWNADINSAETNAKTDYTTILFQASAFNECRVFAPRYRQANIAAYFTQDTVAAAKAFDLAYEDLKTAFQYYLDHYNQGRPIIIASHSQGTTHAERLLKEFFEDKPLKSKLVVAYIIGMRIPKNYFSTLAPCKDSTQTGCYVGWRTYRKGYEPSYIKNEDESAPVTNPLTWTTTSEYAARDLNRGSVLLKFNKLPMNVTDAQTNDHVLWINRPHFPGSFFYRTKNYHIGDINLFYVNIRDNIRTRINAFWKN
ncbi:MAG: DUF3089 domain-containing protein [Bacteroidetes bacterium]|nr:DUF3089 domain-containing protein [Bacteroidota bacterium]